MNFSEQADTLAKNWSEAQKQAWDAWFGMASSAMTGRNQSMPPDPMAWLKQGVDAWTRGSGLGGSTIDKLFSSQTNSVGIMDFLTKAWQSVAPQVEAGKPWKPELEAMLKQWTEQMTGAPGRMGQMGADTGNMFDSLFNAWPSALAPGLAMWRDALMSGHLGAGVMGQVSPLDRLLQMNAEMHPAFAGVGEMPRVGLTREKNAKFLRYADAAADMQRSGAKYQSEITKGLSKAVERTIEKLAAMAEKGEKITSVRELNSLWYRTADATLVDTFNGEEFIAIQNELTLAAMAFKRSQRDVTELFLQALDIPTRTEIDDAYKTIHDLKREVRQLKKAQAAQAARATKPAPRARRKAAVKKTA